MKLSDLKCRKAQAEERLIKLSDGDGLFLHVYPNGKKLWRMSYRFAGKQRDMAFGPYPLVSLLEAREKRYAARRLLLEGKDPAAEKRAEEIAEARSKETTFAAYADIYLDRLAKAGRSEPTLKKARWIVENLAKELCAQQLTDIAPRDVLRVLRVVEAKGNRETARRMRGVLSAVFRLAVIDDVIQTDPSAPLKGALLAPETRHQPAVTKPEAFGALLRAIDGYEGHRTIKLALQVLALTFPRPGELRLSEWPEVDLDQRVWIIPAHRTKMRREHRIPLSRQAREKFEALKAITGGGVLCFPSIRALDKPLSDGALNAALRAMGVDGSTHVAHGFRSSASSLLNEHSAFSSEAIERALAHGEPDKVRRAYNRAQYWDERVNMMQWWADYLDRLKSVMTVILTTTDVQSRMDMMCEDRFETYPSPSKKDFCLAIYNEEKARGTELAAIVQRITDRCAEEEMREYDERRDRRKRELAEAAAELEARFLSGADCKWTSVKGHEGLYCRTNGRAFRLTKDAQKKHLLHRIDELGDSGALIGRYASRADASRALEAVAYA